MAQVIPVIIGCIASQYAIAQLTPGPAPMKLQPGDPGTLGNTASWRTAEFLRDWGMQSVGADDAYAQGYAGQGMNIGIIDSGFFHGTPPVIPPDKPTGWPTGGHFLEHADYPVPAVATQSTPTRFRSIDATGGTSGLTPGFYNQNYNDTHGTHVSGTVGASRDGFTTATTNMHGVAFDVDAYNGNTHKTDGVLYGFQPANASAAQLMDNEYLAALYRTTINFVDVNGKPLRLVRASWGSQPSSENYNTYETPAGSPATFGLKKAWMYLSTPDGVADGNGHTVHWLNGAIDVAKSGRIVEFTAGNGGYANTTPRGSSPYFRPDLEGFWYTTSAITTAARTFNADGSVLVPGTQTFNQCGVAKWSCVTAPGSNINSTVVSVVGGVPTALYGSSSGTSMAGPHSGAVLTLIMQRFPYMTNTQTLYTMFTTSRQNATINAPGTSVPAIANANAGKMVQTPDNRNGWGTVNLKDAFKGPGQFMGNFAVNTGGFNDVWSNNITQVAMDFRKQEDATEAAAWAATKNAKGWNDGLPPGSSVDDTADFTIGTAREAARNSRVYNGSLTKSGAGTLFLQGNVDVAGGSSIAGGKLSILGAHRWNVNVVGGVLGGTGFIGAPIPTAPNSPACVAGTTASLSVQTGSVSPGLGPDDQASIAGFALTPGNVLTVCGAVKMGLNSSYVATIRGNTDYTQLSATGVVAVGGTLLATRTAAVTPGTVLTIVQGSGISGTFKGLPQGSTVNVSGQNFTISYLGGKVTLTAT